MALKDIALSSGSACTSASLELSYALRATGASEDLAHSSIRFGIGRFTTFEEINFTADNNKASEATSGHEPIVGDDRRWYRLENYQVVSALVPHYSRIVFTTLSIHSMYFD